MRRIACLAVLVALLVSGCGAGEPARAPADADPLREFVTHAGSGAPEEVRNEPRGRYLIARLKETAWLRRAPEGRTLRRLRPRTEFGSPTALAVLGRRDGWLQVITPRLANGRSGWIPETAARLDATDYALHVDRSARRVTLRRDGRTVRSVTVGIGRPGNETPLGRFAVTDKLYPTDPASPYGCCALAFSGHQTKLVPGWPGGDRLALHGTPATWSIGKAVTLGCLRAAERDMRALMRRVPLGAPVFIRA